MHRVAGERQASFTAHELTWTELVDPVTAKALMSVIRKVQRHDLLPTDTAANYRSLSSEHSYFNGNVYTRVPCENSSLVQFVWCERSFTRQLDLTLWCKRVVRCERAEIQIRQCRLVLFSAVVFLAPGAQFTKYLTIYYKFIVRSTYDSDLRCDKISFRNVVSQFTISDDLTILRVNCT